MIKVLHLRSSCGLYGADRALLDLAQATPPPLITIVGSIVRGEEDALGDEAERRHLPRWRIQSDGKADFAAARALSQRLVDEGISVVHAHDYKSLALATLACRKPQIPVVATFHGDTSATPALIAYEALGRALGNLTRGVAAVSAPLAVKLSRWVRAAKVHHIPNGVRLPKPCTAEEQRLARADLGIEPDARVLAIVGRLSVEKGHAHLLRAVRRMAQPPVVLAAGDGPLSDKLRDMADDLPVRWLGFVRNTRHVYAAADAVVMPSLTEGLPLVALEAMALERPLVASSVGELPALLRGGAGWLVRPGDEDGLARAMDDVLNDAAVRERATRISLERVRREYALERMAERYVEALYAPALAERWRVPGTYALRTAEGGQ